MRLLFPDDGARYGTCSHTCREYLLHMYALLGVFECPAFPDGTIYARDFEVLKFFHGMVIASNNVT